MSPDPPSSPIRVLYIARAPFISGAERALVSMLGHLDRSRIEPALVLGCASALVDTARSLDIPVSIIPLPKRSRRNPIAWWRSVRQLKRLMKRFQPHVAHANDVPSCQAMSVVGGQLGVARVVHIRWGITAGDAGWWACDGAERILCISGWVRDQLGDTAGTSLARSRVEVLADAVDWPAQIGEAAPNKDPQDEHDEEDRSRPITLGFAGQLIESKGLDLVIEAIGRLASGNRPRLLIAGEDTQSGGAYRKQLEELAASRGVSECVTWLGFLDDVSKLYRRVDAVVCPSRVEPLGLVPLEAARYHLPALANRVGGLAETVQDGQTGVLIDPTVDSWARALTRLGDRVQLRQLGTAAYERTQRLYSPRTYQTRLMKIYHDLISPAPEAPPPESPPGTPSLKDRQTNPPAGDSRNVS